MIWNALQLALREIRRNLMRSFLTILGIVIGVSAVITMVTLGNGATRAVSDQIASLGSNLLIVRPGQMLGPGRDSAGAPRFKVADSLVFMDNGVVVEEGDPAEVINNPQHKRTQAFLSKVL